MANGQHREALPTSRRDAPGFSDVSFLSDGKQTDDPVDERQADRRRSRFFPKHKTQVTMVRSKIAVQQRSASKASPSLEDSIETPPPSQNETRRKRNRSDRNNSKDRIVGGLGGLAIFLSIGILFCLVDIVIVMSRIHLHQSSPNGIVTATSHAVVSEPQSQPKAPAAPTAKEEVPNPILELLKAAGVAQTLDEETLRSIPDWSSVTAMYGDKPVILGLDTCKTFQESGDPAEHFVATAGTFNTGTNLMAEMLIHNCHMPARMAKYGASSRGVRWQVLWGKHTPVKDEQYRLHHRTYNDSVLEPENIMPAVTVRDPFKWMQSMCRHSYGANWPHHEAHCPNLVPNDVDLAVHSNLTDTVPVNVKYAEFTFHHDSLVEFWNDWYQDYFKAPFPRLLVRFEDLLFHPAEVTKTVCECAGGELNKGDFHYIVDSAKKGDAHGKTLTSYVDALVKYGTEQGRYKGYDLADLEYARQHLDSTLMESFGYHPPPPPDELPEKIAI